MFSKFTKGGKGSKPTATKVVKKAKTAVKKATPAPVKRAVSGATKGWLGGDGGAQDLDKWYGECTSRP